MFKYIKAISFFIFYYGYHSSTVIMANTMFSEKEVEYLKSQRVARIATAASVSSKEEGENGSLQPDVVPVGFDFDGDYFYVGGTNILKSSKYKNILKNNKAEAGQIRYGFFQCDVVHSSALKKTSRN
jgi:hypothetical protein